MFRFKEKKLKEEFHYRGAILKTLPYHGSSYYRCCGCFFEHKVSGMLTYDVCSRTMKCHSSHREDGNNVWYCHVGKYIRRKKKRKYFEKYQHLKK